MTTLFGILLAFVAYFVLAPRSGVECVEAIDAEDCPEALEVEE